MRTPLASTAFALLAAAPLGAQIPAFLDRQSAVPGETVQVFVNHGASYQVHVNHSPQFDKQQVLNSGTLPAVSQPNPVGSYAFHPDTPALKITGDITLEAWINPSLVSGVNFAGILMKYLNPGETAYGIYLMPGGQVSFYLSSDGVWNPDNRLLSTNPVSPGVWTHVVATWDGSTKRLYIDGTLDTSEPFAGPIFDTTEPVRVGAFGTASSGHSFLNGSIDSPAIHTTALTPAEVAARFAERADYDAGTPGTLPSTAAQWNFQELDGTLTDATGNGHDLTLVNWAHRSVPGPAWAGAGQPAEWAVRFSQSDYYNPPWSPTWSFTVDPAWEPGFYVVSVVSPGAVTTDLPFIVKRPAEDRTAIAVIAATNTWWAYGEWGVYQTHLGGNINCYAGLRQPNAPGRANTHSPGTGYSHLVDAERYLWGWLLEAGYAFDLYTDFDLHSDPALLDTSRILMISGHSEYWSQPAMDHLEAFQDRGGSVVNLSGNTMWTVVSYDQTGTIMEARKHPWGTRPSVHPPGERWHSTGGGVLGGTIRCVTKPEHQILGTGFGLTMVGITGEYRVIAPDHWAFENTRLQRGDTFGPSANGGKIIGYEADYTDPFWGSPANVEVLAFGVNFSAPALDLDISDCDTRVWSNVNFGSEIIYFDHPGGGGVFAIPSVTAAGSLAVDPVAAQVVTNVLDRFLASTTVYCTPGTSASGCQASIGASGVASATAGSGFDLSAGGVEGQKDGLFFFGTQGRQANPWGNGTSYQCVVPPVVRTGLLTGTGTAGVCDGALGLDLNALWCPSCPAPQKSPGAGAVCQAQLWYRDPASTSNQSTSFSDAIEFFVGP